MIQLCNLKPRKSRLRTSLLRASRSQTSGSHGSSERRHRARRRGVSMYLFVLAFPMMIGLLGIVIDLGNLYSKRAQAQRAADSAALAGAMDSGDSAGNVVGKAREYATLNGYTDGVNNARVFVNPTIIRGDNTSTVSEVSVTVSRKEAVYFAPILEGFLKAVGQSQTAAQFSREVSARGIARTQISLPLGLGGIYGVADPVKSPTNNSVFGPYANYNFGDPYSTRFLQDGVTNNPRYEEKQGVSEYTLHVTEAFQGKEIALQIYDPDCYNGKNGYDEIRPPNTKINPAPPGPQFTTTVYELYAPGGNSDSKPLATGTYGDDAAADGKWVTPDGFKFTPSQKGDYKLRIKTTSGSSENGFQLRAGPAEGADKPDEEWNKLYGDKGGTDPDNVALGIDAEDHLQINFTTNGTVKFRLGSVPKSQRGKQINVEKFDVDVGGRNIVYTCDTLPGLTFAGKIAQPSDGVWSSDKIDIPDYYQGGNWYAEYTAARGDSSTWKLTGKGGREVRLVG